MISWLKARVAGVVEAPSKIIPALKICLGLWEIAVGIWILLPFDSFTPAEIGPWVNDLGEVWIAILTLSVGLGIVLSTMQGSYRWMKVSLFTSFCWAGFVLAAYITAHAHDIFIVSVIAAVLASGWLYLHTSVSESHAKSDNLTHKDNKDTISTL